LYFPLFLPKMPPFFVVFKTLSEGAAGIGAD
jgi:hypothetical protein